MDSLLPGLSGALDLHPLVVHFPIALWLAAVAAYGFGVLRDHEGARTAGRLALYAGTAAAAVAILSGLAAAGRLGHDTAGHDVVHVHRNFMYASGALAVVASTLAALARRNDVLALRHAALGVLLVLAVVMTLGADRGANMVYRYGIGVNPEMLKPVDAGNGHGDEHGGGGDEHGGAHSH